MDKYLRRNLESLLPKLFETFQIITITGPRQSGKSTLIKHFIRESKENWNYFLLDDRHTLLEIKKDPTLFVKTLSSNVVIDEAQKIPDLFHSIKSLSDGGFPHKIILSGSSNFLLLKNITETLAGRVGILELMPLSLAESLSKESNQIVSKILKLQNAQKLATHLSNISNKVNEEHLLNFIYKGGFPKIHAEKKIDSFFWFKSYISTYIERDLRDLSQITDLDTFQKTYKLLAYQTAGILNMNNISSDLGVVLNTIKNYISILEVSYQCKLISPYTSSIKKRLIKNPKMFFLDTGLVNYFQDNENIETMLNKGLWGQVLETYIFSEIYKEVKDISKPISIHFWRTSNGAEVDFVIENANKLYPIEIKSAIQIDPLSLRGIKSFLNSYGQTKVPLGIVIYRGERVTLLEENIVAVPWNIFF